MNKLDEFKYNVAGKNITVIGIGISNLPLIKYLVSLGANVTACDRRIGKPEDVLTIGEEVEAKVTDLNWDEKKISLSIRALIPTPEKEEEVKEEEAPVEDHNAETLVYSTDPEVEVEEAIEVEADDAE